MAPEETLALDVVRLTPEADGILGVELARPDGATLPAWAPGAHVDLLLTPDLTRQYSLCGDPADKAKWKIGVLRESQSRGGSAFVHERLLVGDRLSVRGPRNHFKLVDAPHYLFIAGGIGITPLLPMMRALGNERPWSLLYGGRALSSMAFIAEIAALPGTTLIRPQAQYGLLDLKTYLAQVSAASAVYCCGPEPLVQAVEQEAKNWPAGTLHVERFKPRQLAAHIDRPFEIMLARSGLTLSVAADRTILETLAKAGIRVDSVCREGTCGTCETAVLEGTPDHRDSVLSDVERAGNRTMMLCCSRALTPRLVINL